MNTKDNFTIDWSRLAEPQRDQYDSMITFNFARQRGYIRSKVKDNKTFFDDQIALIKDSSTTLFSYCIPAAVDHPNIEKACNLIRLWPTVFTQCQMLIESVSVYSNVEKQVNNISLICGDGGGFGKIIATVDHYIRFAESLVHEMAHHKLRALGIDVELAEQLIKNSPDQQYQSPIRLDCLRPMSAVFHAQYSFTYVSALHIEIIKARIDADRDYHIAEVDLATHLPALEFGYKIIKDNVEVDIAGASFFKGYFNWLDRVLEDGYKILNDFQISLNPFVHPLTIQVNFSELQKPIIKKNIKNYIKPCRLNSIEEYRLGDEMLLYFPSLEKGVSLNKSALSIWQLCDGEHTLFEISQKIGQQLGVVDEKIFEEILEDIKTTIHKLTIVGILEINNV